MLQEKETQERKVGIAELAVLSCPGKLITLGLGSCVGVTVYDRKLRIGGLVHVMLPESTQFREVHNPVKFADLAIPLLIEAIEKEGSSRRNLVAKMAGGAQMFAFAGSQQNSLNIGQRNAEMSKKILEKLRIPLLAEDTGGNYGRTMILETADGTVTIRTMGKNIKLL